MAGIPYNWGATEAERTTPNGTVADGWTPDDVYWRAIDVDAPPEQVFRWLCQLKVAPYSYDQIDNLGRRSPRKLTRGAEVLEAGQPFMTIFRLRDFVAPEFITIEMSSPIGLKCFGEITVTYRVSPSGAQRCRLLATLQVRYPLGLFGRIVRLVLPWGDYVMMRKQLLTLKRLAERPAPSPGTRNNGEEE